MPEFKITKSDQDQRLDKFLVEQLPDQSRSQIQKMIKSGAVLVNNEKPIIHQFLKTDDIITINRTQVSLPSRGTTITSALNGQKGVQVSQKNGVAEAFMPQLNIIADQPDYLIINKPAGLLVHEAPTSDEPTLVDLLLKKYPTIKKIGEDPMRPGIVHRLDREVSGLLVIAKTQNMFDYLKSQFKTRRIKKEYIALVYGTPQKNEGEINFNIDRSDTVDYKMAAVPSHENRGRKAVTEFEIVKEYSQYSLLKLTPHTGRTHQIRVHLNAYGLPIVGDLVYKPKKLKTKIKMHRIFLHAHYLCFSDLSDNKQEFNSPLPTELQDILEKLK